MTIYNADGDPQNLLVLPLMLAMLVVITFAAAYTLRGIYLLVQAVRRHFH